MKGYFSTIPPRQKPDVSHKKLVYNYRVEAANKGSLIWEKKKITKSIQTGEGAVYSALSLNCSHCVKQFRQRGGCCYFSSFLNSLPNLECPIICSCFHIHAWTSMPIQESVVVEFAVLCNQCCHHLLFTLQTTAKLMLRKTFHMRISQAVHGRLIDQRGSPSRDL